MMKIRKLEHLVDEAKRRGKKWRVAIIKGEDKNTIQAVVKAMDNGFVYPVFIGNLDAITQLLQDFDVKDSINYEIIQCDDAFDTAEIGLNLIKTGQADMIMKGLINTDLFLKAILNKEKGILKPNGVLSYVCALELPSYHKLLFLTDPAVIPFPNLDQKISMANYAIEMAHKLGNKEPKIALIGTSEKVSAHFPNTHDYEKMCALAQSGGFDKCVMDGPLDVFLACDPESVKIKGVNTSIKGDADILLFPTLESCNPFYKGLMLFGGGELAGLIQGTTHPVIVMSRSESLKSKYYCLALACLMAES
ncbi:phosphate acyltransferase [Plebeiibacterium marinum]|uniref:Phosphate acyltransferase n=1 Tax=Plebeiibacterium marinum TaxID=2992111 RepID=A0AAE3MGD6_9BACT|nr:phosphate acyltransferase [Plebeiobacterium marinum]MCW3807259.1 phosphate acyltransferase [Plebeiobacterium marinum]